MKNALIVLAHGSRNKSSQQEILDLAASLENESNGRFDFVRAAFIQFCPPPFMEVLSELAQEGVDKVVVIPFFISAGNHVTQDIPELLKGAKEKYPRMDFSVTPHCGMFTGLSGLIWNEAVKA